MFNPLFGSASKWVLLPVGLLFCVPYLQSFYSPPNAHFFHEWCAAALGLCICLVTFTRHEVQFSRSGLWLLSLIALIGAQFFIHPPIYAASVLGPMVYLFAAWLMITAGATLRRHYPIETIMLWLTWFAFLAGFTQACFGLLQLIGTPEWLTQLIAQPKGAFTGLMGNMRQQNHFADQVTFSLMAGVYLLAIKQISNVRFMALSALILSALALSGSRSVFAYFGLALTLTSLWYFVANNPANKHALKRLLLILTLLLFAFTALQFLLPLVPQLLSVDAPSAASGINATASQPVVTIMQRAATSTDTFGLGVRVELWKTAITAFLSHPFAGLGLDSFAVLAWRLDQGGIMGYTMHSHNLFTEIAMSLGLFGLALLLIYLIGLAKNFWRQTHTLALWPALMMMSVMGIHAMLELPFWYLHFLLPFALLAGLTEDQPSHRAWGKSIVLFGVVLMAILLLHTSKSYALITSAIKAQVPFQVMQKRFYEAGKNPLITPLAESILNEYLPANEVDLAKKMQLSQKIMGWRPYPRAIFKHAVLLALSGDTTQGEAIFATALKTYPETSAIPAKMYCRSNTNAAAKQILQGWIAKYQNGYSPACADLIAK